MTKIAANITTAPGKVKSTRVRGLPPPHWAQELAGDATDANATLSRVDSKHFTLITARIPDAIDLTPPLVEAQTADAYATIASELAKTSRRHPVRFWNHVPLINDPADVGRDNYMVFNAGRFRAFSDLYGSPARFDREVATASAIGHDGRDLVIHCLATDTAGIAVNNPRQVAPYHYSQRFGPLPPCFARATQLANPRGWLLVAGTASVRGEDSVHVDDLPAQCSETFTNLAALTAAAVGQNLSARPKLFAWLDAFTELRVYFPDPSDAAAIQSTVEKAFGKLKHLEMQQANLCRAELLVEIEGVADLNQLHP
jgi:chorismate lyase/3-hydroxybenzoate synthase